MSPSRPSRVLRSALAIWTGVLVVLIVSSARSMPPAVLATILPYLALVGWHLVARPPGDGNGHVALPDDSAIVPEPCPIPEKSNLPASVGPDLRVDSSEARESSPSPASEQRPPTPAPTRPRRRARPRVVAEPAPASWVQVGPGRFVRDEEASPPVDPSAIDEPIAASQTPTDNPIPTTPDREHEDEAIAVPEQETHPTAMSPIPAD